MPLGRPTASGHLKHSITLQKQTVIDDGYGNRRGTFANQFTVKARIEPRLGGESVLAARLTGKNLANITVRSSTNTRMIEPEWRVVDTRTGDFWNIRSVIDPDDRRMFVEMLCEQGVAT